MELALFSLCRTRASTSHIGFGNWRAVSQSRTQARFPPVPLFPLTFSKELKRRGFKFVGPVIVYAWMQAVGIVNDHSEDCFRRDFCRKLARATYRSILRRRIESRRHV